MIHEKEDVKIQDLYLSQQEELIIYLHNCVYHSHHNVKLKSFFVSFLSASRYLYFLPTLFYHFAIV